MFMLSYYGLFRVGQLAFSQHQIKAKDIHIGINKNKILIVLYSSKTHDRGSHPQEIKITSNDRNHTTIAKKPQKHLFFCPFKQSREYLALRSNYVNDTDLFFIFRDQLPVQPNHIRSALHRTLCSINLDHTLYNT